MNIIATLRNTLRGGTKREATDRETGDENEGQGRLIAGQQIVNGAIYELNKLQAEGRFNELEPETKYWLWVCASGFLTQLYGPFAAACFLGDMPENVSAAGDKPQAESNE